MSRAYKCDNCGVLYTDEEYDKISRSYEIVTEQNKKIAITIVVSLENEKEDWDDFCLKCTRQIIDVFNKYIQDTLI